MGDALSAVLDTVARAILGDSERPPAVLGSVALRPHQADALRRVRRSIEAHGGALLADDPGLGKTYVALALATEFGRAIVVAPAALRAMWRSAAELTGVSATFLSMESLSRRDCGYAIEALPRDALVIVDEAHHVNNRATARYAKLARLASYRRVLLLSATPVRNRRAELGALLALFLGPRAFTAGEAVVASCVVQRDGDASLRPAIDGPHWHRVPSMPRLAAMVASLPPPLPALDGRPAVELLVMTLARCWASSLAALDAALRRRLQRGAALESLLDAGRVPTRAELRSWVAGDDAIQLAFPLLAAHETLDAARFGAVLSLHLDAVRTLRSVVRGRVSADAAARARILLGLRTGYPDARIVAFTSHAATAEAVFRALNNARGVALLTARGARTAGGTRPRSDVIDSLGVAPASRPAHDEISLVITTDLLSEGVNLQGASVVVHLDIPWTPAALDQRVGRAARMGSRYPRVFVHGISPPTAAGRALALERRLARKVTEQAEASSAARTAEQLRAATRTWLAPGATNGAAMFRVAAAESTRTGCIAVVRSAGDVFVCAATRSDHTGRWTVSDAPGAILGVANAMRLIAAAPDAAIESSARAAVMRWLDARHARETSGAEIGPTHARRRLMARFDSSVRRSPPHLRAVLTERVARLRALAARAVSAGAEQTLASLAESPLAGVEPWLAECERCLEGSGGVSSKRRLDQPELLALLLTLRVA